MPLYTVLTGVAAPSTIEGSLFMSDFPSNSHEALAMLYVQNQDISGLSPEELFELYTKTRNKITKYADENKKAHSDWLY